jgi:KaiC/GvpD/RAD55 family RecA-like ATPase
MAYEKQRCPSGIQGLDELIEGGFPRGRSIILSGTCGTGKTTFGVQFLYNGVVQYNEPGVFVTLEQNANEIRGDMMQFGFDLKKLEDEGKLVIIDTSLSKMGIKDFVSTLPVAPKKSFSLLPGEFDMDKVMSLAIQAAEKIGAKRLVVDSLPALDVLVGDHINIRRTLVNVNYDLKNAGLTSLIITEMIDDEGVSKYKVEEYVSDGVVILKSLPDLDMVSLNIRKMRITKHTLKSRTLQFGPKGLEVKEPTKGVVI